MSAPRVIVAIALTACLCWSAYGLEYLQIEQIEGKPLAFPSAQELEAIKGFFPYVNRVRHRQVQELLRRLEALPPDGRLINSDDERVVTDAILALGEIRAAEADDLLAERITFYPFYGGGLAYDDDATTIIQFPAASALIEIGRPAVPELLKIIESGDSTEFERRLAVLTLLQIERIPSDDFETPEDDLAKERLILLFEQRKRSVGPATDKTYNWAINYLKGYKEQYKPPYEIPGFLPEKMWKTGWLKDYKDYQEQQEKKQQAQDKTVKTPESSSDGGQQRNP